MKKTTLDVFELKEETVPEDVEEEIELIERRLAKINKQLKFFFEEYEELEKKYKDKNSKIFKKILKDLTESSKELNGFIFKKGGRKKNDTKKKIENV